MMIFSCCFHKMKFPYKPKAIKSQNPRHNPSLCSIPSSIIDLHHIKCPVLEGEYSKDEHSTKLSLAS